MRNFYNLKDECKIKLIKIEMPESLYESRGISIRRGKFGLTKKRRYEVSSKDYSLPNKYYSSLEDYLKEYRLQDEYYIVADQVMRYGIIHLEEEKYKFKHKFKDEDELYDYLKKLSYHIPLSDFIDLESDITSLFDFAYEKE